MNAQDALVALAQLYALAIVLTIALEQVFDTDLYHSLVGKGVTKPDGTHVPSRFLPDVELRPYIATAAGIAIAIMAHLQILRAVLGVDMGDGAFGQAGAYVDRVITGIFLGGGAKTVKRLAKAVSEAKADLAK